MSAKKIKAGKEKAAAGKKKRGRPPTKARGRAKE